MNIKVKIGKKYFLAHRTINNRAIKEWFPIKAEIYQKLLINQSVFLALSIEKEKKQQMEIFPIYFSEKTFFIFIF